MPQYSLTIQAVKEPQLQHILSVISTHCVLVAYTFSLHVFFLKLDGDNEALRGRLRGPQEKIMYTLVPVPDGMDISSIFELDPTTLRGGDSMVPRFGILTQPHKATYTCHKYFIWSH